MITTHVVATCDKFSRFNGPLPPSCSAEPVEFDHAPTADELAQALTEAGYVTKDSGHLCPRHADQGERVTVTGDWQEIAPGVLVRAPQAWEITDIEVKRTAGLHSPPDVKAAIDTLRQAAALMRSRAYSATPGPWISLDGGDRLIHDPGHDLDPPVYVVDEPMSNAANAEHIAAMHPGVTLVLADWFEAEAEAHEQAAVLAAAADSGEMELGGSAVRVQVGMSTMGNALAVALAYLGKLDGR